MKNKKGEHPFGDLGQILFAIVFLIIWIGDSFFCKISVSFAAYIPFFIRVAIFSMALTLPLILESSGHVVVKEKEMPGLLL